MIITEKTDTAYLKEFLDQYLLLEESSYAIATKYIENVLSTEQVSKWKDNIQILGYLDSSIFEIDSTAHHHAMYKALERIYLTPVSNKLKAMYHTEEKPFSFNFFMKEEDKDYLTLNFYEPDIYLNMPINVETLEFGVLSEEEVTTIVTILFNYTDDQDNIIFLDQPK